MKAWQVNEWCEPEQMTLADIPLPEPKSGEVRIRSIAANRILLKNMSVVGCYWGGYLEHHPEFLAQTQADLFALYEAGQIKPVVSQVYPLADAVTALRALADLQ